MHEKYIIRHKILEHLNKKVDRRLGIDKDLNLSNMPLVELAKELDIDWPLLQKYHYEMHNYHQIKCFNKGDKHYIGLEEDGLFAFHDEFWLNEGEKEERQIIEDAAKWYNTELAQRQYVDYPKTKCLAVWAIRFAGVAALAAICQLIVSIIRK